MVEICPSTTTKTSTTPRVRFLGMPNCHCGLPVRKFLYDAMPLYLDDSPLTRLGEFDAVASGVRTFAVHGTNVIRRRPNEIERYPECLGGLVFREHRCDRAVPAALVRHRESRYDSDDPGF